ncbi:hypothetical protein [Pseudorhodoplanes sinuspersici]|uniref:Uncharacterized protein n=1 Tax=Pseudorhodoplanes sinuspersici TaxID=1235591 RepID=A0A1W6ZSI4_9HYPH|nr:hypothetical protein [Pseudorhodoplanes sinuspersici]ARP99704.1 hypothetical protein CAK95_11840 [Pseudorhodoplanes sinuspersici]RKE70686.1 hypothetical protein DFP91_2928 [Pseudorhodoplanes sinuspersici]
MTRQEFLMLVQTWGADISRWPRPQQGAARRFALTDEGKAILDEAMSFDQLLSIKPDIRPDRPADVAFAVMQRVAAERRARWQDWLPRWWVPASLACSALVGVSLAVAIPPDRYADKPEATIDFFLDGGSVSFWSAQ